MIGRHSNKNNPGCNRFLIYMLLLSMLENFWTKLPKPFSVLAPMEGVTNRVFRMIVMQYGGPEVFFTEFVAADGLCSVGKKALQEKLKFCPQEKPIVAQLFGTNPEHFSHAAQLIAKLGFDGIDINMGCPDKTIMKHGSGGALIKNPQLAKAIIQATKAGANKLPVSVKTRIGFEKNDITNWMPLILE